MTETAEADAPTFTSDILHAPGSLLADPVMDASPSHITPAADYVEQPVEVEPVPPPSRADAMKAKVRAVLAAQPYRGHDVHKADLLAVIDALIDGPDVAEPSARLPQIQPFDS